MAVLHKWKHIEYEDGSNPYICTTEKEFARLRKRYGSRLVEIKQGFYYVKSQKGE